MNYYLNERIESARLLLRMVEEDDWIALYKIIKSNKFPSDLPLKELIQTENDAQNYIKEAVQAWRESKKYMWTVCFKEDPNIIAGQISITKNPEKGKWSIAFWIVPEYQNCGYAKESIVTLTEKFKVDNKNICFWAGAATWNNASNKVLIDSGFKMVGTQENGYICNGKTIAINIYEKATTQ